MKRYFILTLLCIIPFFAASCGKEAPHGGTITIKPDSISYASLAGNVTVNITVYAVDGSGNPLVDTELKISGSMAAPRSPARYQFYKKPDAVEQMDSGFTVKTNEYGIYNFSIVIYTNAFTDYIEVRTGSAFNSVKVEVT